MLHKPLFLLLLGVSLSAWASMDHFKNDLKYAQSQRGSIQKSAQRFKPEVVFKNYTDRPSQSKYYNSVTQGTDQGLAPDAESQVATQPAGTAVVRSFKKRPVFTLNPKSQAMQRGAFIKQDAHDIAYGIPDKYVDCKRPIQCQTTYAEKNCNEQIHGSLKTCTKTAEVTVEKTQKKLTGSTTKKGRYSGWVTINQTGLITTVSVTVQLSRWTFGRHPSATLAGAPLTYHAGEISRFTSFSSTSLHLPVKAGSKLLFSLQGVWGGGLVEAEYTLTLENKHAKVAWQEVCSHA